MNELTAHASFDQRRTGWVVAVARGRLVQNHRVGGDLGSADAALKAASEIVESYGVSVVGWEQIGPTGYRAKTTTARFAGAGSIRDGVVTWAAVG